VEEPIVLKRDGVHEGLECATRLGAQLGLLRLGIDNPPNITR
jgi:hypothetical protein